MSAPENPLAFPVHPDGQRAHPDFLGMTLRDWFAAQALLSIGTDYFASGKIDAAARDHADGLAEHAYCIADAMLAARMEKERQG